ALMRATNNDTVVSNGVVAFSVSATNTVLPASASGALTNNGSGVLGWNAVLGNAQLWTNRQDAGTDPNYQWGYIVLANETNATPRISFFQRSIGGLMFLRNQTNDTQVQLSGIDGDASWQLRTGDNVPTDYYVEAGAGMNPNTGKQDLLHLIMYNDAGTNFL